MKTLKVFLGIVILMGVCVMVNAQKMSFQRDAVLTKQTIQSFIKYNESLFADIKEVDEPDWFGIIAGYNSNPRSILDEIEELEPPKTIQNIFKQFGLDPQKGHVQIAIMQYGVVALEIEEALIEISPIKRSEKEKKEDKKVKSYLNELLAQINTADLELIRNYRNQLRPIFNTR